MRHLVSLVPVWPGITSFMAITLIAASGCVGVPDDTADPPEALVEIGRPLAFAGHDYHFFTQPKDWVGASVVCLNMGGRLVKIDSAAEESFLADEELAHGGGAWWIGLNDMFSEGLLRWEPGFPAGYLNFAPGQPDNQGNNQDCVYDGSTNGQWDDFNCQAQLKFICENSSIPTSNDVFTFPFNVSNTNNALQNYFQFAVTLDSGLRGAEVGTCGMTGSNYLGDTFIRIFGPNNQQIAFNDDACFGNFGSNISFMAANGQSQSYFVHVGCFSNDSCSGTVAVKR